MKNNIVHQGILMLCLFSIAVSSSAQQLPKLKVSGNHRYLVQKDGIKEGKPFFYLGDTAWELFTRLSKPEVEKYFQVRKEQGFNVIMAISHNEVKKKNSPQEGANYPNREGFTPFSDKDHLFIPESIVPAYWEHVDWVFKQAEKDGLYIAFLPYWGNLYAQKERANLINNNEMAYNWGYFLGNRYKEKTNIIWVIGGDYEPWDYKTKKFDPEEYMVPIATAEGVADGINGAKKQFDGGKADYSTSLMTYHINEGLSSSKYFHKLDFLDFNGIQSGHNMKDIARNYQIVEEDYDMRPVKPTIDLESWYEYIKVRKNGKWEDPRCYALDIRRNAYRSILAGAMGYTYGNNNVWLFFRKNQNYEDKYNPTDDWDSNEGIYSEGASQIMWVRNLFMSRPYFKCSPAPDLMLKSKSDDIESHVQAALAEDKSFALLYIPSKQILNVDLTRVSGKVACWWYNPVNGTICDQAGKEMKTKEPFKTISQKKKTTNYQFTSPANQDWVLVLDDVAKKMPVPGTIDLQTK